MQPRTMLLLVILASAPLAFALPTQAQAESPKLHFTADLLAGALGDPTTQGCDKPDPTYALVAGPAPAAGKAYTGRSTAGTACATWFEYTAKAPFTLTTDALFSGVVDCDTQTPTSSFNLPGVTSFAAARFTLMLNDKVVGEPARFVQDTPTPCTPGTGVLATGTVEAKGTKVAAGDVLRIDSRAWFATGSPFDPAKNVHWVIGTAWMSAGGLPSAPSGTPGGGAVRYQTVATPTFSAEQSPTSLSSDTYIYNWTAGPSSLKVTSAAQVANGSVTFLVKDGSGTAVIAKTYSSAGEDTQEFPSVKPGTFTVSVQLKQFKGSFRLDLGPASSAETTPPPSSTTAPPTSSTPGGSPGGTTNSNGPSGSAGPTTSSDSTPGPALATLGIALVAAVALARRKTQR